MLTDAAREQARRVPLGHGIARHEIARLIASTTKAPRHAGAADRPAQVHPFTPANRSQLLARGAVLRLPARPSLAPVVRRLLNREGERLLGIGGHFRAPPNRSSTGTSIGRPV